MSRLRRLSSLLMLGVLLSNCATQMPPDLTPSETIAAFYRSSFGIGGQPTGKDAMPPFSREFLQDIRENETLYAPEDSQCGWRSLLDPYLNVDGLAYDNTVLEIKFIPSDMVEVTLDLPPSRDKNRVGHTVLAYIMVQESGQWKVDDIWWLDTAAKRWQSYHSAIIGQNLHLCR